MDNKKSKKVASAHNSRAANCYVATDGEKIKVKPEGRDGIWLIEKDEAIKLIKNCTEKKIHNFIQCGPRFLGADWNKSEVIKTIKNSERVGLLTGEMQKQQFRHALSVIENNELKMFDVGEITERDLQVLAT